MNISVSSVQETVYKVMNYKVQKILINKLQ